MIFKTDKQAPRKPGGYSKDAIKKMAVLFTDIVGSSKYFKKHGDIQGRKMLKVHQDLASPPINEFGGTVVKMLGDSVMAYFLNPEYALKSAIKIQQKFQAYNKGKSEKDTIYIRLCVHYGDGIVDEGDIFGDVVNMAAKFLPLAGANEIIISQDLHSGVRDIPLVKYQSFDAPNKNKVLEGLKLLKVIWDSSITLDPTKKTLVHLRPMFNLGKSRFENTWNKLIAQKSKFWSAITVEKEQINTDRSISLIVKKTITAMDVAKHVMSYLSTNMGKDADVYLPMQVIIDTGAFISTGRITPGNIKVNWNQLEPGAIYISETTYKILTQEGITSINLETEKKPVGPFFQIAQKKNILENENVFRYQNALINGDLTPCFYCGSQSHYTTDCPSKMMTEITGCIESLGYMTLEGINNLFFHYLQANENELKNIESMNPNSPVYKAHCAFNEINSIFQLRLFRTIWNTKEDNWNKIKTSKSETDRGGLLWIALDCLRVSNLEQVESIIEGELKKKSKDYKLYCLAGLLYIEKNQFKAAVSLLKKALDMAIRNPEKVYILFLLYRIHYLRYDEGKTRDTLRRILKLSPYCTEATYLEIVNKFKNGSKSTAISQLISLIKRNRDYYIISLIDPELSDYNKDISKRLDELFMETREYAEKLIPAAKEELSALEKIMGKESEEIREAYAQVEKIGGLISSNSYFAYLDIIHYGEDIMNLGKRIVKGREIKLARLEQHLAQKIERCKNLIELLPYNFMIRPASTKLRIIQASIEKMREKIKLQGTKEFQNNLNKFDDFDRDLISLENKLRRMDLTAQFLGFLVKFLKRNLIFQSANLILSLLLLPLMVHYLNFLIPDLNLSSTGIWHYQKILIILGGITGIVLSSLTSQKGR